MDGASVATPPRNGRSFQRPGFRFPNLANGPAARRTPAVAQTSASKPRRGGRMTNSTTNRRTMKIEAIDESRLSEELSRRVDVWITAQPEPRPTRPEAIRRLLAEALDHNHRVTVPPEAAAAGQ